MIQSPFKGVGEDDTRGYFCNAASSAATDKW